jgi:hypothetical protein
MNNPPSSCKVIDGCLRYDSLESRGLTGVDVALRVKRPGLSRSLANHQLMKASNYEGWWRMESQTENLAFLPCLSFVWCGVVMHSEEVSQYTAMVPSDPPELGSSRSHYVKFLDL